LLPKSVELVPVNAAPISKSFHSLPPVSVKNPTGLSSFRSQTDSICVSLMVSKGQRGHAFGVPCF
jgi:hypothetical protein